GPARGGRPAPPAGRRPGPDPGPGGRAPPPAVLAAAGAGGGHRGRGGRRRGRRAGRAPRVQPPPAGGHRGRRAGRAPIRRRARPSQAGGRDMRTVWPYVSRAEGYYSAVRDVATGKHPELIDAARTAVTFVQQYVGPRVSLTAGATAAKDRGVGVVVNRQLPDG